MPRHRRSSQRSWRLVGIRVAGTLTLLLGVSGGLYLEDDNERAQREAAAAYIVAHEQAALVEQKLMKTHLGEAAIERARLAAQAAAAAEAARKKAAEEAARKKRPPNFGPIPASCQVYKGNRAIGCTLMLQAGFGLDQMPCLDKLWTKESGWNERSHNRSSGAYGIPQALPGSKMSKFGGDWEYNPATQVKWGLSYIKSTYDTPCGAWQTFLNKGWY